MSSHFPLKAGALIDIVAPSGKFSADILPKIITLVTSWGLRARIPENILGEDLFAANNEQARLETLYDALCAEDSDLVWCVRGGYGATRIAAKLCQLPVPPKPKLLVGFSDVTTLQLILNQNYHWASLHGPMARQAVLDLVDEESIATLKQILFHGWQDYQLPSLRPLNQAAKQSIFLEGTTAGTCLSLIQNSIGTPWQFQPQGKILFLEDVNEAAYRIDRLLIHLQNAGLLQGLAAIVFGTFGSPETKQTQEQQQVIEAFASSMDFPVFCAPVFGHEVRNMTIPLGVRAKIEAGSVFFKSTSNT